MTDEPASMSTEPDMGQIMASENPIAAMLSSMPLNALYELDEALTAEMIRRTEGGC
jgi:hypothetical protein